VNARTISVRCIEFEFVILYRERNESDGLNGYITITLMYLLIAMIIIIITSLEKRNETLGKTIYIHVVRTVYIFM